MKGTNWGRIAARMTAILIVTRALDYVYKAIDNYMYESRYAISVIYGVNPQNTIDTGSISVALMLLVIAFLLWRFSDKFAPVIEEDQPSINNQSVVATVLIVALGAFIFLRYASWAITVASTDQFYRNFSRGFGSAVQPVYHALISILGLVILLKAKAIQKWVNR